MKILFDNKKEVVDFIVDFYQSDIANRIMRFMDDYGDECDAAVNRERYIQEEAEEDDNERMKELLEEEVMKVRSCGNICSCLPVMELNGKDITSELWHIILDAPLAYVCYGGNREAAGGTVGVLMVTAPNAHPDHDGTGTANADKEDEKELLDILVERVARVVCLALAGIDHHVHVCADGPKRFVQEHGCGHREMLGGKGAVKGEELAQGHTVGVFREEEGAGEHACLHEDAHGRGNCRAR